MSFFTRDLIRTLIAQGPTLGFGLATSVLTARALGPEARGGWSLCFLIVQIAVAFTEMSLGQALVFHAGRRGLAPGRLLGALLPLLVLLGGAVFAAIRLLEAPLLASFPALGPEALRLSALLAAGVLANTLLTDYFRALDRLDLYNLCRNLSPGVRLALLALALLLGARLEAALLAAVAAEAVVLPVQLALAARLGRPTLRGAPAVAGPLLAYGARVQGAVVLGHVDLRSAGFLVAYFASAADLAFYTIADGIVLALIAVPTLVANVLQPKIARQSEANAARMTAATCRSTLFLALVLCAAIAALARPLVEIVYGAEYLPAAGALVALLPVAVARSGVRILSRYLLVANRVRVLAIASAVSLTSHVLLLLALVPPFGIIGAGLAMSLGYMAHLAVVVTATRRETGLPLRELLVVGRADVARLVDVGREALGVLSLRRSGGGRP